MTILGKRVLNCGLISLLIILFLTGCQPQAAAPPTPPSLDKELTLYYYQSGIPQSILDKFTQEYGVTVNYEIFTSYEDAYAHLKTGEKAYDVVLIGLESIRLLIDQGLITEINPSNIPNRKNIAANFRDLVFDPGDRYTVPWDWGTTGLITRSDLVKTLPTRWHDLWDYTQFGPIGIWQEPRTMIALALKSLGYSANATKPEELEAARQRLLELRPHSIFLEEFTDNVDPYTSAYILADGRLATVMGWAYDQRIGHALNESITYILPEEGTLLWSENFVIPAASSRQYTAEVFINFMLRPEISAEFTNLTYYSTVNQVALPLINADIRNDKTIFPGEDILKNGEILLPLPQEVLDAYLRIWDEFAAAEGLKVQS